MPSKHIDQEIWLNIQKKTVETVAYTQEPIKDTEILKILLTIAIKKIKTEEIVKEITKNKK